MSMIARLRQIARNLHLGLVTIPRGGLVLEVGSGDHPFMRSDILCDRYVFDNTERVGSLVIDRPLVVGDIYDLPFRDKIFDFVVCHHVLEHLEDPETAARELSRVAKAGSIRVPAKVSEKLTGSVYHRWFISRVEDGLLFEPKNASVFDLDIKHFMKYEVLKGRRYGTFYAQFRNFVEVQYLWRGTIHLSVDGERPMASMDDGFRTAQEPQRVDWEEIPIIVNRGGAKQRLRSILSRLLRKLVGAKVSLGDILACPTCKGALIEHKDALECGQCGSVYPCRQALPVLVLDAPRTTARSVQSAT